MAHSIVKVTDSQLSDRLLLVVDPDGTVTPDKETVQTYLNSRPEGTDFEVMHVNKINEDDVDLSVETLTYVHSEEIVEESVSNVTNMDELSRNLYYFRMDHDYTPLTSPKASSPEKEPEIVDELAQTLSILDGSHSESELDMSSIKQIQTTPRTVKKLIAANNQTKGKSKVIVATNTFKSPKSTNKIVQKEKVVDEPEETYDGDDVINEEENDSDFEIENAKAPRRRVKRNSRSHSGDGKNTKMGKTIKTLLPKQTPKVEQESQKVEINAEKKPAQTPQAVVQQKKEKKPPKPIPDDFALFSSPDIIRRVGGGKAEPESPKNSNENRQKVASVEVKGKRLSTELKSTDQKQIRSSEIRKSKEQEGVIRSRRESRNSTDLKNKILDKTDSAISQEGNVSIQEFHDTSGSNSSQSGIDGQLEPLPNSEDIRSIIGGTSAVFTATQQDLNQLAETNINLESAGLDLDQSLLDNINADLISEDILYQVAQSLADNTELQNVIDKTIVDGSLTLDTSSLTAEDINQEQVLINENAKPQIDSNRAQSVETSKGTHIVRPDGRIVVIPPIERPTTRSRNRRNQEPEVKQIPKVVHKPLDEEHVSGNELDSESDKNEEEDDEDEDDPDKLWCICNQPHNNRFMICCDTCEEWYHGKCVNVTKAMGQMMEQEGKEWICLFCKDSTLKRPSAAARRIRKASRTSTDSSSSQRRSTSASSTSLTENKTSAPACIVCGKPSRINSIYCSDGCILKHAQGVEKVVVFERKTGKILSGSNAPSAANLEKWLQEHPGFEAVRSTSKPQISKSASPKVTQSKLKIVKNSNNDGVSLALHKKGVNIGVLQHAPKDTQQNAPIILNKQAKKITGLKIISKQVNATQMKAKVIQALPQTPLLKTPNLVPTKIKAVQSPAKPVTSTLVVKEKSVQQKLVKTKTGDSLQMSAQPKQENIRENVRKTLFEQLTNRLKLAEDLKLTEDEVNSISTEIESQLYKCFGDTSQKYRNKYRSLIFNIKDVKNQTLWRRICEKTINPYQLVRLSPDDLASQELALWRERETKHQLDMIKKSELELLNCNRQYVFKTHKGEEVFEDDRPKETVDSTEVITGFAAESASDHSDSKPISSGKDKEKKSSKHGKRGRSRDRARSKDADRSRERSKDRKANRRRKSSSKDRDRHKRSRSRDRYKHEKKRSRSRERDRHRRSSHKSSRHKKDNNTTDKLDKKSKEILEQLVDKQIVPPLEDRLWKHVPQEDLVVPSKSPTVESDSDHEPTSTVTIPTPPQNNEADNDESSKTARTNNKITKIDEDKVGTKEMSTSSSKEDSSSRSPTPKLLEPLWNGVINMADVSQISVTAHEVSGDCSGLGEELPPTLYIIGRISPETVWDYIGKMKCSNSKMISLLRLHAINVEEQMPYIALYSYLSSRKRLGVVEMINKAIKDFYILPLANQKPIPQALLPISGPGFEESRPPLLLGIVVRDKRKRPAADTTPYTVHTKRIKTTEQPTKSSTPPRSYTPPPSRDPRLKPLPLPVAVKKDGKEDDMDEPYSPEDSDPDTNPPEILAPSSKVNSFLDSGLTTQILEPFTKKFDTIPGLDDSSSALPLNSQELQRKMAELDQKIAMEKAVIDNMSQDIASSAGAEIGASAFSNIAFPSNLQQILDSIKTIGPTNVGDGTPQTDSSDLTIPLMLPKISSRTQSSLTKVDSSTSSPTIPLKLPKIKSKTAVASNSEAEKPIVGVLSSLTEEDLIRKAAEMLGENETCAKKQENQTKKKEVPTYQPPNLPNPPVVFSQPPPPNLKAPPPNLTTLPPNLTTHPPNLTTHPPNLTTPPPNLTTPPPNLTSSTINLVTPSIKLTTSSSSINLPTPDLSTPPPNLNTTTSQININASTIDLSTPPPNLNTPPLNLSTPPPNLSTLLPNLNTQPPNLGGKRSKIDLNQPPIPGLEDET